MPLHFKDAELSDAVKLERCLVNHIVTEIEVSCLPADLPESIVVDLSKVARGDTIHLSSLTLPEGVTAVTRGEEDPVLVTVSAPKGGTEADEEAAEAAPETPAAPAADAAAS